MRVFLMDKDVLVREGLAKLLEFKGCEVCGSASSLSGLSDDTRTQKAEVLVLTPEDGLEQDSVVSAKEAFPGKPILVLATRANRTIVRECLLAGADGFLVRWAHPRELYQALTMLVSGKSYLHPEVIGDVITGLRQNEQCTRSNIPLREMEVLRFVAAGANNAEIAAKLYVSPSTVKNLLRSLFDRFEVGDRTRLVAEAMKAGTLKQ